MSAGPSLLVVEPYFGGSHRAWAEGIRDHLGWSVELATLPPRWWKWRMRGGAVTLSEQVAAMSVSPDLVLASDMIDLPAFLTFARPHLGDAPVALYFHESQLTYPDSPQMDPDISYGVTNWLSALAADRVFFNSHYHREVFFSELPRLLSHFPDCTHAHRMAEVEERSEVLEVGVDLTWVDPGHGDGPLRILWNHRWEHDKDPSAFFAAVDELAAEGLDFELVVCGENFRNVPEEFDAAADRHQDRIVHMGYAELAAYRDWLTSSDVVVSTARHEFFGVAVVEAIAAGCMPVLPDRLSYPELIPDDWHAACLYPPGGLVDRLRRLILDPAEARRVGAALAPGALRFGWDAMAPRYRAAFESMVTG